MPINGDPLTVRADPSAPLPVTVDGAVVLDEPVEVTGTIAVSGPGRGST